MLPDVKNYRNILIAVDESENAKRAVLYVRDLLEGIKGFHITIVTISLSLQRIIFFLMLKNLRG